jgi:phosphoribosylanthranilate isomerase
LRLLFDAAVDGAYGGTGSSVPRAIAVAARDATRASEKEFFLAGGIGPGNVAEIIESVGPDGLDVSSGVEEGPGKKSRAAMERLFAEISRATGKGGKGRVDEATR